MKPIKTAWWKLVSFGFRLLYYEMAFTYDMVANVVSLGQWWDWQRTALDFLPPPQAGLLLELAHGTGRFQIDLQTKGWQTVGFDLSPHMGRIARRRLIKSSTASLSYSAQLVRGTAQTLPFPNETFAGVVSTFPTPFIIQPETLDEVWRVLTPSGRLVFVPSGVLTKGGLAQNALEGAYRATGQRGDWGTDLFQRFSEHGFTLQQHTVELKRSYTVVMVAQKVLSANV